MHCVSKGDAKGARRDLTLTLDLPPRPEVRGHPGQVHQAVMNLVQNAMDAVREVPEPRVEVGLTAAGGKAVLTVQNNGPGVAETDRLRVFDPFFTTKPVAQGTGLGLSISYGIVTDHGGTSPWRARRGAVPDGTAGRDTIEEHLFLLAAAAMPIDANGSPIELASEYNARGAGSPLRPLVRRLLYPLLLN